MEKIVLKNGIPLILKDNKDTPRIAMCINIGLNRDEKNAGEIALIKALLFQGTKTKTGEQLATILEENGIDCYVTSTKDSICFRLLCLNEDFKKGLEILNDIIFNSTFDEFEKERIKIKGELLSDLDSPQTKAFDEFAKEIYKNHQYGHSRTKILSEIDNITKDDVIELYNFILNNSPKNIAIVGDFNAVGSKNDIMQIINDYFGSLTNSEWRKDITSPVIKGKNLITKIKSDSAQAQIIQGWLLPSLTECNFPPIYLMNTILGASGLSSRLFQELREKKGLAYTVRSCFDLHKQCACLWVYIGTNPVNIQTAVDGFKIEIEKLKSELVSEEELVGGKNNILGKIQFTLETNMQQANNMSSYELLGLGYDFNEKYQQKILATTAQDIKDVANKYFTDDFLVYALAPNVNLNL